MSIGLCANTTSQLNSRLEAEKNLTKEDIAYFKWNVAEWKFERYGDEFFGKINKELIVYALNTDDHESFSDNVINTMITSLKEVNKNIFTKEYQATFL